MTIQPDDPPVGLRLRAEYPAAAAQERAGWKMANDIKLGAVQRVQVYGRWLTAAQDTKALSIKMGGDRNLGATIVNIPAFPVDRRASRTP
jgi:hypothetical protein